jgi:Cysteine-rich CPXCG
MKRPRSRQPSPRDDSSVRTPRDIDALYGLEPVFEPDHERGQALGTAEFHSVQCPYCGERFDTLVDPGTGAATYIEDCQICCQPIEFELRVDSRGAFAGLSVRRS